MDLQEHLRQAWEAISDHPKRVIASSMGVFWGTAAILLLTSSATGFREFMKIELSRFGPGTVAVHPSLVSSGFAGYRKGTTVEISREAMRVAERESAEVVAAILPEHLSDERVRVEARGRVRRLDVSASDERFASHRNFEVECGRFYGERDVASAAAVAVIGQEAAKDLFERPCEGLGSTIRVNGQGFEVIGVTRRKGRQYFNQNRPDNRLLMIPVTAAEQHLGHREEALSRILVYPRPRVSTEAALGAVRHSLGPRSGFHPEDRDALRVYDFTRFSRITDLFYTGFMIFIGIAGTVTLLVAGVGIANYHLAMVEERTVEIGVAKAIGARNRTLVLQTACESLLISGSAALAGALFGLTAVLALSLLSPAGAFPMPILSPVSALVAGAATSGVAAISAIIPALRVARVDVSVALRGSA
jgi:putative ABC transport system permease protein